MRRRNTEKYSVDSRHEKAQRCRAFSSSVALCILLYHRLFLVCKTSIHRFESGRRLRGIVYGSLSYTQTPRDFLSLSHSLTRVVTKRERVVVHRRGKAVAALVPLEDLALLEGLEDRQDLEDFRAAKEEWERNGRKTVPWAKIKADLGL